MVEGDGHATAVRVEIVPVSAGLTIKDEAIANESIDDATDRE
jgi:hypothetical protein